jgi:hypothetical protein
MSEPLRDARGRFAEPGTNRERRLAREHNTFLIGVLGGQPTPGAEGTNTPSEPRRAGMEGGWLGDDHRAHERRREVANAKFRRLFEQPPTEVDEINDALPSLRR